MQTATGDTIGTHPDAQSKCLRSPCGDGCPNGTAAEERRGRGRGASFAIFDLPTILAAVHSWHWHRCHARPPSTTAPSTCCGRTCIVGHPSEPGAQSPLPCSTAQYPARYWSRGERRKRLRHSLGWHGWRRRGRCRPSLTRFWMMAKRVGCIDGATVGWQSTGRETRGELSARGQGGRLCLGQDVVWGGALDRGSRDAA